MEPIARAIAGWGVSWRTNTSRCNSHCPSRRNAGFTFTAPAAKLTPVAGLAAAVVLQ